MKLIIVSGNIEKVKEIEKMIGIELEVIDIDLKEIQDLDVERITKYKVKEAFSKIKKSLIVEDTGLYIDDLKGLPGGLIKWFMKTIGNEGICKISAGSKAHAITCIGFYDGKEVKIFSGRVDGSISDKPCGNGFGWDSVFIPDGYEKTFGEMGKEEKNKISMRRRALEELKKSGAINVER